MESILVTLDTSQPEMSPSNDVCEEKTACMLVTSATNQDPIGPFGPLAQFLSTLTHSVMALESSSRDLGGKPVVWGMEEAGVD